MQPSTRVKGWNYQGGVREGEREEKEERERERVRGREKRESYSEPAEPQSTVSLWPLHSAEHRRCLCSASLVLCGAFENDGVSLLNYCSHLLFSCCQSGLWVRVTGKLYWENPPDVKMDVLLLLSWEEKAAGQWASVHSSVNLLCWKKQNRPLCSLAGGLRRWRSF